MVVVIKINYTVINYFCIPSVHSLVRICSAVVDNYVAGFVFSYVKIFLNSRS